MRAFVDAAGGLTTAGYCRTRHVAGGVRQLGRPGRVRRDRARSRWTASPGPASRDGVARLRERLLADLDGAVLGARAAAKARAGDGAVELPPGRYEVVLEPTAVADLLQALAMFGFNGKAVNERRSFVDAGEAQFDPAITLVDDAVEPGHDRACRSTSRARRKTASRRSSTTA